jgi:hypothetical protein
MLLRPPLLVLVMVMVVMVMHGGMGASSLQFAVHKTRRLLLRRALLLVFFCSALTGMEGGWLLHRPCVLEVGSSCQTHEGHLYPPGNAYGCATQLWNLLLHALGRRSTICPAEWANAAAGYSSKLYWFACYPT